MEQVEFLAQLQKEDQILDGLRQQIRQGPERMAEIERQVQIYREDLEAHKKQLEETQKAQRRYESELEHASEQIAKSKGKLLTIKTNKEYQAFLKEIEDAERMNTEKEEKTLNCMEEMERLGQILREREKSFLTEREKLEKEKKDIHAEVTRAQEQLSAKEKQRAEIAGTVDPELLGRYERLKVRLGGLAVALVENTVCSGCHLNIPPQMYNELQRRDSLKFCPHCDRIIYWKDHNAGSGDMSE